MKDWVRVSERLPEKDHSYIIVYTQPDTDKWDGVHIAAYKGGKFTVPNTHIIHKDILYWMALPEPPEGETAIE